MDESSPSEREQAWLLASGWTWQGDRLIHPTEPGRWVRYDPENRERTPSPEWSAAITRLEQEADRAAARARDLLDRHRRRAT